MFIFCKDFSDFLYFRQLKLFRLVFFIVFKRMFINLDVIFFEWGVLEVVFCVGVLLVVGVFGVFVFCFFVGFVFGVLFLMINIDFRFFSIVDIYIMQEL